MYAEEGKQEFEKVGFEKRKRLQNLPNLLAALCDVRTGQDLSGEKLPTEKNDYDVALVKIINYQLAKMVYGSINTSMCFGTWWLVRPSWEFLIRENVL